MQQRPAARGRAAIRAREAGLAGTAAGKLGLGVVGLGRPWESRHRPALARLGDRFAVTAVYDQVARRAEIEARQLGCRAFEAVAELVASPEVDAVAWLAPQWFGTYPVELAARAGKPIYCAVPWPDDPAGLARLEALAGPGRPPLMIEFAPRFAPAAVRLREILRERPDPARTIEVAVDLPRPSGPAAQVGPGSTLADPGQAIVDLCRFLTGAEVAAATLARGSADAIACDLTMATSTRATIAIAIGRRDASSAPPPSPSLVVRDASGGEIRLEWPDRLVDRAGPGRAERVEVLPAGPPIAEVLFDQFHRLARGLDHRAPTWADALAAARGVALIRRDLDAAEPGRPSGGDPAS